MGISADPEWLRDDVLERAYADLRARAGGTETYEDACVTYAMAVCYSELMRRGGDCSAAKEWGDNATSVLDWIGSNG